jgi:S1-C subfamily serine protease
MRKLSKFKSTVAIFIALLFLFFLSFMANRGYAAPNEIVGKIDKQSVKIAVDGGTGSGILFRRITVNEDGDNVPVTFIWTAAHVIKNNIKATENGVEHLPVVLIKRSVKNGTEETRLVALAEIYKVSFKYDLAILKVAGDLGASASFDFSVPNVGKEVYLMGSPKGIENLLLHGTIARLADKHNGVDHDQLDATALPGNSGCGVFDKGNGDCIGLLVRVHTSGVISVMVPSREMLEWATNAGVPFAIDANIEMPKYEDLGSLNLVSKKIVSYELHEKEKEKEKQDEN